MTAPIEFPNEDRSNAVRRVITRTEPVALRTYTPSQVVIARSAGVFHWTADGRRLYDYSSGVLVANLGHNPRRWMRRFAGYMGWDAAEYADGDAGCFEAVPLTAYNAITEIEARAVERLLDSLQASPHGRRLDTVMWAASGSEAIQKALWACLHRDENRDIILATRHGFHGKKGLAGAVTGTERDRNRDPRVKFISFPMDEIDDIGRIGQMRGDEDTVSSPVDDIDLSRYAAELDGLWNEYGRRINCLITEPYLGGGGSYHPPAAYLQLLERFCRQHDVLFILDEIQSNFGRTGAMYAFEKYGVEPDLVCLGKGLGNGVPASAAVGRGDVMGSLKYGEASDTWSANPLAGAAVLATLDEFEETNVLEHARQTSEQFVEGLLRLKDTGLVAKVRGEGLVFGVECAAVAGRSAGEIANAVVAACYLGEPGGDGLHLLGPLAGKVLRISPPLTISEEEARDSLELLYNLMEQLASRLGVRRPLAVSTSTSRN